MVWGMRVQALLRGFGVLQVLHLGASGCCVQKGLQTPLNHLLNVDIGMYPLILLVLSRDCNTGTIIPIKVC